MTTRNWLWTINRRLRRLGFNLERFPASLSLIHLHNEIFRITDQNLEETTSDLEFNDFATVLNGYSLILKQGLPPLSQLGQDAWVVGATEGKSGLRYLEIGAYDPYQWSNTAVLRDSFGWTGISVDPSEYCMSQFERAGLRDSFLNVAIGDQNGKGEMVGEGAFATAKYITHDLEKRQQSTISFITPLDLVQISGSVDYLSLDIEGQELTIIQSWPFDICRPKFLTIEHNNRENDKRDIILFMKNLGYREVLSSVTDFESWFILN